MQGASGAGSEPLACALGIGRARPSSGPRADGAGPVVRVFVTSGDASRRFHRWCPTESIFTHSWYRVASLVQPQRRTHAVREYDV